MKIRPVLVETLLEMCFSTFVLTMVENPYEWSSNSLNLITPLFLTSQPCSAWAVDKGRYFKVNVEPFGYFGISLLDFD